MDCNQDQFLFTEKYRPKNIDDCVLPESTKGLVKALVEKGELTNALFAGSAGVGKCLDPNEEIEVIVSDEIFNKINMLREVS